MYPITITTHPVYLLMNAFLVKLIYLSGLRNLEELEVQMC